MCATKPLPTPLLSCAPCVEKPFYHARLRLFLKLFNEVGSRALAHVHARAIFEWWAKAFVQIQGANISACPILRVCKREHERVRMREAPTETTRLAKACAMVYRCLHIILLYMYILTYVFIHVYMYMFTHLGRHFWACTVLDVSYALFKRHVLHQLIFIILVRFMLSIVRELG